MAESEIIKDLEDTRKRLQVQIKQHDQAIQNEAVSTIKNTLLKERAKLQAQLDYLDRCITGVRKIESGETGSN